ncbi:glycogen synthase [Candidatus Electronema sp. PJ]|uniref:glycogen synthase n=1 Tax=Candidatus Electronema sp. PJ TaxID=3401572 RepID=UPI003AA888AF
MNLLEEKKILMVAREYDGLAGAGGVKDVCRQLAEALAQHGGFDVRVVLPLYGFMDALALGFAQVTFPCRNATDKPALTFEVDMHYPGRERREEVGLWVQNIRGVTVYLLDSKRFTEKHGVYTYTAEEETQKSWQQAGVGHFDYFAMNILLQKAALDMLILLDFRPNIVHCHDGHAALLPAMMRENEGWRHYFCRTGAVVTIHNAGLGYHQEVADIEFAEVVTGLPASVIRAGMFNSSFDPFAAAAGYAVMNTVSENYAHELQKSEEDSRTGWLGHHLLRKNVTLAGITNGINPEDFNPRAPEKLGLDAAFDPATGELAGKHLCKEQLLAACSPANQVWQRVVQHGSLNREPDLPLFTFIGRLTAQKGVDVLLKALSLLAATGETSFQTLILGNGEKYLEEHLEEMAGAEASGGRLCFLQGYDQALANKIYAAGDFFLIPSLYEPCGLTDYIAQLFGNLPVVHHVGGLVKVIDQETGFTYQEHAPESLAAAMQQALNVYRHDRGKLAAMQRAAVERIRNRHTWQQVMQDYLALYQQALR